MWNFSISGFPSSWSGDKIWVKDWSYKISHICECMVGFLQSFDFILTFTCPYLENQIIIGFLRELDTFKSMVWRCCKLIIRFLEGREQIWKFIWSCFIRPWILCYNCASELRLSSRLTNHFNKSLINILQLVWLSYGDPEWIYGSLKLTFIFSKMGLTQVLTYPCMLYPKHFHIIVPIINMSSQSSHGLTNNYSSSTSHISMVNWKLLQP